MNLSLTARVAAILLAGLLVVLGISVWLQASERDQLLRRADSQSFSEQIVSAVQLLEATAPTRLADAQANLARAGLRAEPITPEAAHPKPPRGMLPELLAQRLGGAREVRSRGSGPGGIDAGGSPQARSVDVRLANGQWFRLTEQTPAAPASGLPTALWLQLGAVLLLVAGVSVLAVHLATQPLKRLATAAEALGRDLDAPPLPVAGSAEMRHAAQAFNAMQAQIRALVQERERALAAVSHDLRTPLTRLRLRCELVDDETLRAQLDKDISAMASLIDSTLGYLRERSSNEPLRALDLNALLESLADDARVQGRSVTVHGFIEDSYPGRLSSLRRALQNLIDNAFKYGATEVTLEALDDATSVRLNVSDNGPGIAPQELTKVTQPYYRPDPARSRADGSVGLGLAIASDVARQHGGRLELSNQANGGLCASLVLARAGA